MFLRKLIVIVLPLGMLLIISLLTPVLASLGAFWGSLLLGLCLGTALGLLLPLSGATRLREPFAWLLWIPAAVILLILLYQQGYSVNYFLKLSVSLKLGEIGDSLQPFCNVGIPKMMGAVGLAFLPIALKCSEATRFGKTVENCVNRAVSHHILLLLPKSAGNTRCAIGNDIAFFHFLHPFC